MLLGCPAVTDAEVSTASNEMINFALRAQFLSEEIFHLDPRVMTKCAVES